MELLDDPERTAMVISCLPEELPVTETIEAAGALRAAELPLGAVVANQVTADHLASRASRLPALARDPAPLLEAASRAGTRLDKEAIGVLLDEARDRQRQVARERRLLKELRAKLDALPVVELPLLADGAAGPEAVRTLAACLTDSPLAGKADARAAALALRGAQQGRRTCVVTIDPARRLAQALGLDLLSNEPRPVRGKGSELREPGGLDAMMLDMRRTFDEVIERYARD